MKLVTVEDYVNRKIQFFSNHHEVPVRANESPLDEYGYQHKTYVFGDNTAWYEMCGPSYEEAEVKVKNLKYRVNVKLLRIEYWSTDDPEPYVCYKRCQD